VIPIITGCRTLARRALAGQGGVFDVSYTRRREELRWGCVAHLSDRPFGTSLEVAADKFLARDLNHNRM